MPANRVSGARVWTTLVAVACAVSVLAFAHRALALTAICDWTKQVWINDGEGTVITKTTNGPFGVVVSDTVHVQDRLSCLVPYQWRLHESWHPDFFSLWRDPETTSGDVSTGSGSLDWWGSLPSADKVYLDKYLYVAEPGWVTTEISETVQFTSTASGLPIYSGQLPFYLVELVEGGDAPSSYNHSAITMTTHLTGTVASFPVVWDWDGTMEPEPPSYGFCHWSSFEPSYLGITVTHELDADVPPDDDTVTNIDPDSDLPDQDDADDGVIFPTLLPHCGTATVSVEGKNNTGSTDLYLNSWADWNRDGDWNDTSVCECGISEWVIQRYTVAPGPFDLTIPISSCHPVADPTEPLWARFTLSEPKSFSQAPWIYGGQPYPASTDPLGCFWQGETEDYLVRPELIPECGWEKQVYINDEYAGEWDEGPFPVAVSDTVTISDSLKCNFGFDWNLLEEWEDPYLSLVGYELSHGSVVSDTGWLEWSDPYAPPGIPVTLTKTLHVDEPGFYTLPITETLAFSPEGLVQPVTKTVELVELLEGGDAPSSHHHAPPATMETYPGSGVSAQYPVVWDWDGTLEAGPVTGYYGFCHHAAAEAYLGSPPSVELDADVPPDRDLVTNIDPANNTPDRDLYDDGVTFPGPLPRCVPVNVQFTGHNSSGTTLYLNAWADWNRDGDWEEGTQCGCGDHEWTLQDYAISPGAIEATIPITPCHTSNPAEPAWIRVTLSEAELAPLGTPWVYGGQPHPAPQGCFELGETEDFLLRQGVAYVPLVTKRY